MEIAGRASFVYIIDRRGCVYLCGERYNRGDLTFSVSNWGDFKTVLESVDAVNNAARLNRVSAVKTRRLLGGGSALLKKRRDPGRRRPSRG